MKTLNELKSELAEVDQRLYAAWLREREDARRRIAEMAVEFQLSPGLVARDIAAEQRSAAPAPAFLRAPAVDLPLRRQGVPQYIAPKYRNPATGDSWTGRGSRPRWLQQALDAGAVLEDFLLTDQGGQGQAPGNPLREFQDAASRARLARASRGPRAAPG